MSSRSFGLFLWLTCAGFTLNAFGLETAYVNFSLPSGWFCELDEGVWVCSDDREPTPSRRLVLSIATVSEPTDTFTGILNFFQRYLPTFYDAQATSHEQLTGLFEVNKTTWIHSVQDNADFPGYTTDYFTTLLKVEEVSLLTMIVVLAPTSDNSDLAATVAGTLAPVPGAVRLMNATQFRTQGNQPIPFQLNALREFIIPSRLRKNLGNRP
ncbi:MAG: hypothetical protein H6617_04575 [Bdellovibrionaceae bacterium]|nr:hypothetical protein [Bdellovibrionales bacterium]MCB9253936.1 hypothetical protein [Pseudobdellovibrionaceae bacterium]